MLAIVVAQTMSRYYARPIRALVKRVLHADALTPSMPHPSGMRIDEIESLKQSFATSMDYLNQRKANERALHEFTRDMIHESRQLVSLLRTVVSGMQELPSPTKHLLKKCLQRSDMITSDLLAEQGHDADQANGKRIINPHVMALALIEARQEKQLCFPTMCFELDIKPSAFAVMVPVPKCSARVVQLT